MRCNCTYNLLRSKGFPKGVIIHGFDCELKDYEEKRDEVSPYVKEEFHAT